MKNNLKNLFNPKSIAVVGASETEGKIGYIISRNILDLGFEGEIFFVNPKYEELFGRKCYASLNDLENEVDLAVIVIPSKFVNQTVKEAGGKVKNFIVISAGFSETGKDGKERERELLSIAEKNKVNILGPNCLGFIAPKIKLNASFAGGMPEEGNISFVSQSGALAVAIMDVAEKEQIKFSQIISVGNKMQINETGLIEYLGEDENTKVIAMYLEGIENGKDFIEVARKVSQKKPIVVLKAGRSEKAQKAIASHTGSLAGSDKIMDAAFEKAGVIRANNLEEFFGLIKLISNFELVDNPKTAIITNAGGPGVLTTDSFQDKELELVEFSDESKAKFRDFLPEESSVENPVDLLGDAKEDRYQKALEVLEKEDVGNIICLMTAQDQTPTEKISQVLADFSEKSGKNIIPVFIGGEKMIGALKILNKNNIPNFSFPKEVVDALNLFYKWKIKEKNTIVEAEPLEAEKNGDKEFVSQTISSVKKNKRKALLFGEAGEVMKRYNIPVVDFANLAPNEKMHSVFNFPAALKVDSDKVLHKTDKQGLILGIQNMNELEEALKKMRKNFPKENLIIQPMIKYESELILGLKKDPIFGPVLVYGLGGIYTEVFKMVDFLLLPLSKDEIKKNIENSKISFLFKETRGKKVGDIDEMTDLLFNFSLLAEDQKEIKEIDINPLLIDKNGKLVAVDIKIIL